MNLRVLIVEDEPTYAFNLEMLIDQLDFECSGIVDSAASALEVVESKPPDLILMDINISGEIDGIDLAQIVNKKREIPIIFITSLKDEEVFKRAKLAFPAAFILKPFDSEQLLKTIEIAVLDKPSNAQVPKDSFFIKQGQQLLKVKISEIAFVEVEERYCSIFNDQGKKFVIRKSLSELLKKLPNTFQQSHRKYAVNTAKIQNINLADMTISLGQQIVPLSKNFKADLLENLDSL